MLKVPVSILSEGIELRGEFKTPGDGSPLIVLCHGIPLSEPDPSDGGYPALADQLLEHGYASLYVNFRGAGNSEGSFSIGGWCEDLAAVMEYAHKELVVPDQRVFMVGFSAGGALAINYAAEHKSSAGVAAFAAPARFTDIFVPEHLDYFFNLARDIGIISDPGFPPSNEWFLDDIGKHNADDFVSFLSPQPLLIVHGDEDDTVPVEHGKVLFEKAGGPKELIVLKGSGHRLRRDPAAVSYLFDWLEKNERSAV